MLECFGWVCGGYSGLYQSFGVLLIYPGGWNKHPAHACIFSQLEHLRQDSRNPTLKIHNSTNIRRIDKMNICNFEGFSIFSPHTWIIHIHPELAKLFKCKGFPVLQQMLRYRGYVGSLRCLQRERPWSGAVELLAGKVGSKWVKTDQSQLSICQFGVRDIKVNSEVLQ